MSLLAVSLPLATDPNTKAACRRSASGINASRNGMARPKVLRTMATISSWIGLAGLARYSFCLPNCSTLSRPLPESRASSRCTAPLPAPVVWISSLIEKLRPGWPNRQPSTRCWVAVNRASDRLALAYSAAASLTRGLVSMPISGRILPELGKRKLR